jgi:acyl-coenzyme A thioesterase PaaI-like protein
LCAAEGPAPQPGAFDRDTAIRLQDHGRDTRVFAAEVADGWRAGRGPHGGYLAAMILRALMATVEDPLRAPRSLTIHFVRAPQTGPVRIATVLERQGRSISTLSARMEQDGRLMALALCAFSVPWTGPSISEVSMPDVAPPGRDAGTLIQDGAPPLARHITLQRRIGGVPFADPDQPMEIGGWLGLAEPRPIDALSLAFFCDALIPAPFMRMTAPSPAPTIDLTVHFRVPMPRTADPDPHELCLARIRAGVVHEGLFEEDVVIWAADGTVLAQSRQLAILMAP